MHVCTGARGAEIPCHSTLQRWTGLFGRCCRLSRPWCAQGEQIIDEVSSRNGRLPKVTARADAGSSKASSRSLLQSSQVPFPPRSPGPCHPVTTTVGGFFYFFVSSPSVPPPSPLRPAVRKRTERGSSARARRPCSRGDGQRLGGESKIGESRLWRPA